MNKNGNLKKLASAITLLLWSVIALSSFYITQRPLAVQVAGGIISTLWSISLLVILLFVSAGLGYLILARTYKQLISHERLILGTGFGLGVLGLTGFGLAAVGLAAIPILVAVLSGMLVCIFILKVHTEVIGDLQSLADSLKESGREVPLWLPLGVLLTAVASFLFALLPPADGFDGLLYHLRLPEQLLADGKMIPYNNFPFWFPSLIEGDFLWALGLGSERTAQLIHWSFFILVLVLTWKWSHQVFGYKSAWWALAILISMPSLPWLASWAYTDLALTFFCMASLYSLWRWYEKNEDGWLLISGTFAGMAMGVKYTSFILPVLCVLMVFSRKQKAGARIASSARFSIPALLIALPWYLRNWRVMGNPFYPFVFGGRFWDVFRTNWYNGIGTGIGWNFQEIALLPFAITLGYRDQTFYDGRIGPLFLMLFPPTLWIIWIKRTNTAKELHTFLIIGMFTTLTYLLWAFSVTQTIYMWQSRLLFTGLIPFSILIGFAITQLDSLNLQRFRISFILTNLIGIVVSISLLDNCLTLIVRRPLNYILGIESREAYFERIQPNYSQALKLVETTPKNSYVYFFLEPRSYTMPRKVQPDALNDNLAHDYYLFKTTKDMIKDWKQKGYTHILVYDKGFDFFTQKDGGKYEDQFDQIVKDLKLEKTLGRYTLYSIP